MNLEIKESLEVLHNPEEDSYIFFSPANRTYREFKVDGLIKKLISLLTDGKRKEEQVLLEASREYPTDQIDSAINALEKQGILIRSREEGISSNYDKQISFISEFVSSYEEANKIMEALQKKRVAVFGVGGMGSWMINGLVKMGVQYLNICDPDIVSATNLNRQLYFESRDIGRKKVEVISERLRDQKIRTFDLRVSKETQLDAIVQNTDLIVNCADEPSVEATSRILEEYSRRVNVPLCISGGYNLHRGFVGPILIPGITKTLEDYVAYHQQGGFFKRLKLIKPQTQTGSLGCISGIIANIQCAEIFKYFTGIGKMRHNQYGEFDFLDSSLKWIDFSE